MWRLVVVGLVALLLPPKGGSHEIGKTGGSHEIGKTGGSHEIGKTGGSQAIRGAGGSEATQPDQDLLLWYREPATNWNEALPIGNGRLGAMVFGGVVSERLQLNEDTIWAGEKRDRLNPAGPAAVAEVRRLLLEGKAPEAEALADKAIIATPRRIPPYQPLGDLKLVSTTGSRTVSSGISISPAPSPA
jgi:hypothetical protein